MRSSTDSSSRSRLVLLNLFSFSLIVYLLAIASLQAQQSAVDTVESTERYWKTSASLGLNFSQVQLSNWAGGGQSSVSVGSIAVFKAHYNKGRVFWENDLDMAYGLIRQGDGEQGFRKTDDLVNFLSKYNYRMQESFFITALANFRTQMDVGYDYTETGRTRISDFMAPGFLVASLGATHLKKGHYSITLSPIASKFTFVMDQAFSDAGAFGVDPGSRVRGEVGASLNAGFEQDILENVNFKTNLICFANYQTLSRIDVNWEGTLLLKINSYLNTTIASQLIYDHDIIQKIQWRNAVNVGFLIKL